jgi:hypothetical protein
MVVAITYTIFFRFFLIRFLHLVISFFILHGLFCSRVSSFHFVLVLFLLVLFTPCFIAHLHRVVYPLATVASVSVLILFFCLTVSHSRQFLVLLFTMMHHHLLCLTFIDTHIFNISPGYIDLRLLFFFCL